MNGLIPVMFMQLNTLILKKDTKFYLGKILVDDLSIDKHDLRLQCESEIKKILIRLRQTYLGNSER